jgi:hypothetical protein
MMRFHVMRNLSSLLLLGVLALPASGCGKGAKGDCPQLDICGGSPVGTWGIDSFCQVLPVRPNQPGDVNDFMQMTPPQTPTIAPPTPNPVVAAQTTSGDWCSNLFLMGDPSVGFTVANAVLWHSAPQISLNPSHDPKKVSSIAFGANATNTGGDYLTKLVFENEKGVDMTHFAPQCLLRNGAVNPTCDKLADALNVFYKAPMPSVPPTFGDISCSNADDGGCDCIYDFIIQVDDSGTWALDPNDSTVLVQDSQVLTFNGAVMNAQASTTTLRSSLCRAGNTSLELSGERGGSLSNVQGLRTLSLVPQQ